KTLLDAVKSVKWYPEAGERRITGMLQTRPDWCLSRQRHWGTPIPAVHCRACGEAILDQMIVERVASRVEQEGSDVWFARPLETFLPEGYACRSCGKREFRKEEDILDVWFDSGVSWQAVLRAREAELGFPADLYLEGSDQHRGWFQVSLIPAVALEDRPPFRAVLTHGFVLDGEGRAMSKSRGNVISPQEIIKQYGADILRLWVAAEDYREDIRLSETTLRQMAEGYRRVRNTLRFLLGNMSDLPKAAAPMRESMQEIDLWAMHRLQKVIGEVGAAYEAYEFHKAWRAIHQFCAVDLSAFYFDVLKDRLYTFRPDDPARRAAQATLDAIFSALVRLLAPIIPFTAEEAWGYRPGVTGRDAPSPSPLLAEFPLSDPAWTDQALGERWDRILEIRGQVWQAVEQARREQGLGGSLEARVTLRGAVPAADWPALLIVSEVEIAGGAPGPVTVEKARGRKCVRCWRWTEDVGRAAEHPELCARCAEVVRAVAGEAPHA
ncbi:MAG: class I tRNA ligase family protein, partial [bacterium]